MSFLRDIREAARQCADPKMQLALRDAADNLATALDALYAEADVPQMQAVNSCWSYAARVLKNYREPKPPAPVEGGLEDGALLQKVA